LPINSYIKDHDILRKGGEAKSGKIYPALNYDDDDDKDQNKTKRQLRITFKKMNLKRAIKKKSKKHKQNSPLIIIRGNKKKIII
jgi:hypothetical protein